MDIFFVLQSIGLGAGLAMDACAVSMSDGLNEPKMKKRKMFLIAATFGVFQALMPIIGYFAGHALIDYIGAYIPWIALALLTLLGGKMIFDGAREIVKAKKAAASQAADGAEATAGGEEKPERKLTIKALALQAVATSIDALSVGVSISNSQVSHALVAALIIAVVTFGICIAALFIGKKFGDKLGSKAVILGGIILIGIGLEICLTGVL